MKPPKLVLQLIETYREQLGPPASGEPIEEVIADVTLPSVNAVRSHLASMARAKLALLLRLEKDNLLRRPQ